MPEGISRKAEDTFDSECFEPSNGADDGIACPEDPEEPEVAGGTAENVLCFKVSPPLENPGEKSSGLLCWEIDSPLYVERDAENSFL